MTLISYSMNHKDNFIISNHNRISPFPVKNLISQAIEIKDRIIILVWFNQIDLINVKSVVLCCYPD